jgi:glycosyltransferase involved in cell wall biosynthesis
MGIFKKLTIILWQCYNSLTVIFCLEGLTNDSSYKIFYGGARKGYKGGPFVKISLLQKYFPEYRRRVNLVYCVSGQPYLSKKSLIRIKKKGIPIVLNQNGVYSQGWYGSGWEKQNDKLKHAYELADFVFWQSEFCKKSTEIFLGLRQGPGDILYNAVDISKFKPSPEILKSSFTFLVSGNLNISIFYRVEAAVRAFYLLNKKVKDTELMIVGVNDKLSMKLIKTLISDLGIKERVKIKGKYSQNQAPEIYNSSDAYIMLKYMDASPNVVIEAMASGLPIVYSDTGGVRELVGKDAGIGISMEQGWSIPPAAPDPRRVADAMHEVMFAHSEFSSAARTRAVKNFNIENWIDKHREVFRRYV